MDGTADCVLEMRAAILRQTKSPSCTIQEGQTLGRDDKAFEKWDNKEGGINPLAGKSTRSAIPRGLTRYSLADRSYISREI